MAKPETVNVTKVHLEGTLGSLDFSPAFWRCRMKAEEEIPLKTAMHLDYLCKTGEIRLIAKKRVKKAKPTTTMENGNQFSSFEECKCFKCFALPPSRDNFYFKNNCKLHSACCSECFANVPKCKFCKAWKKVKVNKKLKMLLKAEELATLRKVKDFDVKYLLEMQATVTSSTAQVLKNEIKELNNMCHKYHRLMEIIDGNGSESEKHELRSQVTINNLYLRSIPSLKSSCQWCFRNFSKTRWLNRHIHLLHNSSVEKVTKKQIQCPVTNCNFTAEYESEMKRHVNKRRCKGYTRESRFQCQKCGKRMLRSNNVLKHEQKCNATKKG